MERVAESDAQANGVGTHSGLFTVRSFGVNGLFVSIIAVFTSPLRHAARNGVTLALSATSGSAPRSRSAASRRLRSDTHAYDAYLSGREEEINGVDEGPRKGVE